MPTTLALILLVLGLVAGAPAAAVDAPDQCAQCHRDKLQGFAPGHQFGGRQCTVCHGGDGTRADQAAAHAGMTAFPGDLAHAPRACGGCHHQRVEDVRHGFMATGKGIVNVTRWVFGEQAAPAGDATFAHLTHSPADSMLRKLCAGCHLGQSRTEHRHQGIFDRGGGCAACHINAYPQDAHPRLSARVSEARCFGCHARSARLSLNYYGLAEVDPEAMAGRPEGDFARLPDRRLVEHRPADLHHRAGLGCTDCHTGPGLMGSAHGLHHHEDGVDIACADCHANRNPRVNLSTWPEEERGHIRRIPFPVAAGQEFLTTGRRGTPLWHVRLTPAGPVLHRKADGEVLAIPQMRPESHPRLEDAHQRLACDACHGQWAPQCYGCHSHYEDQGTQYDHLARERTPGRWGERRWGIRNDRPPLGVDAHDRIRPFVPGMILTLEHPELEGPRFQRLFAATAPHTTGPARACVDCHRDPVALGLGQGRLSREDGRWRFTPTHPPLQDGLPADAWTTLDGTRSGGATRTGERPFTATELQRVLDVPLPPR